MSRSVGRPTATRRPPPARPGPSSTSSSPARSRPPPYALTANPIVNTTCAHRGQPAHHPSPLGLLDADEDDSLQFNVTAPNLGTLPVPSPRSTPTMPRSSTRPAPWPAPTPPASPTSSVPTASVPGVRHRGRRRRRASQRSPSISIPALRRPGPRYQRPVRHPLRHHLPQRFAGPGGRPVGLGHGGAGRLRTQSARPRRQFGHPRTPATAWPGRHLRWHDQR